MIVDQNYLSNALVKASYLEMTHIVLCLPVLSLGGQEWPSVPSVIDLSSFWFWLSVIWLSLVITNLYHFSNKKN